MDMPKSPLFFQKRCSSEAGVGMSAQVGARHVDVVVPGFPTQLALLQLP